MNRVIRATVRTLTLCLLAGATPADPVAHFEFTVDSKNIAREQVPMMAELHVGRNLTPEQAEALARGAKATIGGVKLAQAEVLTNRGGTAQAIRVHWIEPGLPAGAKRHYDVGIEPMCGCEASGFRFEDNLKYRDLNYEGDPVYRYVLEYDPEHHADTFKPYHQIYGFHEEGFLTKGPGGYEPHHQGISWAWNTQHGNFWTGTKGVYERHIRFLEELDQSGPVTARSVSLVDWCTADNKRIAHDTRDVRAFYLDSNCFVIDFQITTEAIGEPLKLMGDSHHAGLHFRAADEVAVREGKKDNATYMMPAAAKKVGDDTWEAPWAMMKFEVKGNRYSVVQMNDPSNPRPTVFSTRAYGRMGAFFSKDGKTPVEVEEGKPLTVKYRFVIFDGKKYPEPSMDRVNALYSDYTTPATVTAERAK